MKLMHAVVCGLLACGAGSVGAQEPRALTLAESVRLGLERSPVVGAADAAAVAVAAQWRQVRASQLPALRAQGSLTRLSGNIPAVEFALPGLDSTITFQGVELDRSMAELSVELPLLTQLRLREESRAAAQGARVAALEADQARTDLALEIRRAYWERYRAGVVREHTGAAVARVDEHLAEVRRRLELGAALRRDLLSAQARRSEVLLERLEAENAVRLAELELNRLMGLPLDTPLRLTDPPTGAEEAAVAAPRSVNMRPDVAALSEQVLAERARLRASAALRWPELDFVGRLLYARPNPYFFAEPGRFHGTWELGLAARWGIWEGGRVQARQAEAGARLAEATARLAELEQRAAVEQARHRLELARAREAVVVAEQNVAEAEESYRVAREQYAEGVALATDVLDAEQALREAQTRLAAALADRGLAVALLLHAEGRVW